MYFSFEAFNFSFSPKELCNPTLLSSLLTFKIFTPPSLLYGLMWMSNFFPIATLILTTFIKSFFLGFAH